MDTFSLPRRRRGCVDHRLKKHYKILREEEIKEFTEKDISIVSSCLSVSRGLACTLLRRNHWSPTSVFEEWFSDEVRARESVVGVMAKEESGKQVCKICYEDIGFENIVSAACGHPFCADCWKTYVSTSINDGPKCLTLRCPEPDCETTVGLDMVESLASTRDIERYNRYLRQSYVKCSREIKWCPAPGCDLAIEFDDEGYENYEVVCGCSYKFCWKCMEESHHPVDCKTAEELLRKSISDAESIAWIEANTKKCPECHWDIEQYKGRCSTMKCFCGYLFCWICLRPLLDHKSISCMEDKGKGVISRDEEMIIKKARKLLETMDYNANDNDKFRNMAKANIDILAEVQGENKFELRFVYKAWDQIGECRRLLKWIYAYEHHLSLRNSRDSTKMKYFEFLEKHAEAVLERLHHCAEKEVTKYLQSFSLDFNCFRLELVNLTAVARKYFENFFRALEDN